jgi:hypothetical protein
MTLDKMSAQLAEQPERDRYYVLCYLMDALRLNEQPVTLPRNVVASAIKYLSEPPPKS